MKKVLLYNNQINGQDMSLFARKINHDIEECHVFQGKEFLLIGVSLGNSYFNKERIELLLRGFSSHFKRVAILLVDDIAEHNYRAIGYDEKKIIKKVRRNGANTANNIQATVNKVKEIYPNNTIEFYRWKDVEMCDTYHSNLKKITYLYETNVDFRKTINESTGSMIEKYLDSEPNEEAILEAKCYLLKELSFGSCINEIFDTNEVVTAYYRDFKFYREFFKNESLNDVAKIVQELIIYECTTA